MALADISQESGAAPGAVTPDNDVRGADEDGPLDLNRLIAALVSTRNVRVAFEAMGWKIASQKLKAEEALYGPEIFGSYEHGDTNKPNSATDYYDQAFRDTFRE